MSRAERRQYQRMMKGVDRTPQLPAAARVRAEKVRERRAARAAQRTYEFGVAFWLTSVAIAALAGLLGMSLQWSNGPGFALWVGGAVGAVALAAQIGIRFLQRRATSR